MYRLNEIEHRYGENIHILDNPVLSRLLLELSVAETIQPRISWLLERIYGGLIDTVVNREFPTEYRKVLTRMSNHQHDEAATISGRFLERDVKVVVVNIATAGDQSANTVYNLLNQIFTSYFIRQDHLMLNRVVSDHGKITGCEVMACKIGGDVENAIMILPDPMGATGGTIEKTLDIYEEKGRPKKVITVHMVIAPKYIKRVQEKYPNLIVYAVRLDRGLSPSEVLETIPGTNIEAERGLNDKGYILPGAGDLGGLINNRKKEFLL